MYINIHSHQPPATNEWVIQNLYKAFERSLLPGSYSVGLHPWYIHPTKWENDFNALKKIAEEHTVLAIGECGLDKICNTDFMLQEEVFIAQLLFANEINKPLIIHCVRAYEEVLLLLTKHKNKVPVIFHGFNKNRILAEKIINQGYYLSFGKALFEANIKQVFAALPADKIFLETDDADTTIKMIYTEATSIKNISEETLSLQLIKNVQTVFNKNVLK
ncbi:MAG: TatD family hydrolase [Ferruginibacter sp.]